jgi:hypothetical protein
MGKLSEPTHPLWSLIRLSILMLSLVFVLWMNASSFDKTEIQTIVTMFMVAAGVEGASQFVRSNKGKGTE